MIAWRVTELEEELALVRRRLEVAEARERLAVIRYQDVNEAWLNTLRSANRAARRLSELGEPVP